MGVIELMVQIQEGLLLVDGLNKLLSGQLGDVQETSTLALNVQPSLQDAELIELVNSWLIQAEMLTAQLMKGAILTCALYVKSAIL